MKWLFTVLVAVVVVTWVVSSKDEEGPPYVGL